MRIANFAISILVVIILYNSANANDVDNYINIIENDNNSGNRISAIVALGRIGDEKSIDPLIQALNSDSNSRARTVAANALGKIGNASAVKPLINVLNDRNENVRIAAIEAIGKIGDKSGTEPLIQALDDRSEDIQLAAIDALTSLNDPQAIEPLSQILKSKIRAENDWRFSAFVICLAGAAFLYFILMCIVLFFKPNETQIKNIIISAIYILILIFVDSGVLIMVFSRSDPTIAYVPSPILEWAFTGGIIGVLYRLTSNNIENYVWAITKPVIGLVMGGVVYFIALGGGILIGLPQDGILPKNTIYLLCAFAFVAGFSEKFSIDLINRLTGKYNMEEKKDQSANQADMSIQ